MKRFLVARTPFAKNSENGKNSELSAETTAKRLRCEASSSCENTVNRSSLDESGESVEQSTPQVVVNRNDIGNFVDTRLSESQAFNLLKNVWVPSKDYAFPFLQKFEARGLKFCYKWLEEFSWLAYSELHQGAFRISCVAFAKSGGKGSQTLDQLVKTKFDNWKKAKETFQEHQKKSYHIHAIADRDNFLRIVQNREESIENLIDESRKQQILKNRQNMIPVVEAIIVLGRQELALRGHRDSGNIVIQDDFTGPNEGNFRALLKYRAKGDPILRSHLEGPRKRDKFTSPSIQNEIIDACYEILTQKAMSKIKAAKFYSILTDETQDLTTIEQVTLCIRYVSGKNEGHHIVCEDFLRFF
ncbi:zinc finger MYM-type protein 1-like [Belonocnema kinseyi]|uniref:zinc finger MYM-type protein 1-like n=1 Tax=Belonocnema kinseyi TaxID=2817044 RepID=UPI00143D2C9C|nr:zinc finger MYM-type protein 1-like [Belonocnema kinseyi]